jgi:hypothetical protein
MSQFILLIQGNLKSEPTAEDWAAFFSAARQSGMFQGGSEIGMRWIVGDASSAESTKHVVGYMRFDADDKQQLLDLLQRHPVVVHGGSVELCEMPQSRDSGGD